MCAQLISCPILAALNLPRYKYMVQVVIGEQRGEGVRYEIIQQQL